MKKKTFLLNNYFKCLCSFALGFIFYLFFVAIFNRSLADYDLWGYLSFGRIFWEEGFFPYRDIFSYIPTKPLWVYHEWLTGVVFFGLIKYFGPASLQLFRYVFALLTIYLIFLTAIRRGGSIFHTLVIIVPSIVLISFGYFPVRAQVFTFFFFILTLYILEYVKKTEKVTILRWLPLIQIFWCNLHGGFISGLGLIFLYALGEGFSRRNTAVYYAKWGVIATLATLLNPYGIEYWSYTIHAVLMPRPEITEWYSVVTALKSNVYVFPVALFLLMSLLILLGFLIRRKKDVTELLVIAAVIYLGSVHVRHGVLFGLVLGAYAPVFLTERAHEWNSRRHSFNHLINLSAVVFSSLLIITYFHFFSIKQIHYIPSFKFSVTGDYYPTKAIRWMKTNNVKGNILPHFDWGEYLIWSCYPDCRVAMDGRFETVYQDNLIQEYFNFLYGRDGWNVFLKKYPHDIVLLKTGTRTNSLMMHEKDWQLVYHDHTSVLFMKKSQKI